jgi:dihydrofolate reductase
MRRIVLFDHVSADGYFAAADGNLDWVVQDDEIGKAAAAGMSDTDTILFGRRTYEMFARFWPHALDDSPTAPNPHGGSRSPEMRAMAVWLNETPKLVFSRTLKHLSWNNSRLVHELDTRAIEAMKQQPGGDMIVFGSGSLVSQLTEHGLIDEYQFVVSPILLGNGRSPLSGMAKSRRVELVEAQAYRSGNVKLRYARAA